MAKFKPAKKGVQGTQCPVTRKEFRTDAPRAIPITIFGHETMAGIKEFSSGALGWHLGEKVVIKIGDQPIRAQVALTITILGSKELPE